MDIILSKVQKGNKRHFEVNGKKIRGSKKTQEKEARKVIAKMRKDGKGELREIDKERGIFNRYKIKDIEWDD